MGETVKKILLIDGNSMLFRAYYGTIYTRRMSTSTGLPTNAVYGFVTMLHKAIETIQPDSILVAWDAGKPTFRHEKYKDYKGTRKELDEDLIVQMPIVREFLDAAHIVRYEEAGFEADDIIGSMAKKTADIDTTILTSDKDLLQLIAPTTRVLLMKKGITEMELMDEKGLFEKYELAPMQITDLKGLMGDASDNIPGVKGIGEKTALKLLHQYETVEGVYEHIDELKGKMKEKLETGKEDAFFSKELATIYCDMDLPIAVEDLKYDFYQPNDFFQKYEMKSLIKTEEEVVETKEIKVRDITTIENVNTQNVLILPVASDESFLEQTLFGFMIAQDKEVLYLSLENASKDELFLQMLKDNTTLRTWDSKAMKHLLDRYGFPVANFEHDLHIASFLLHSQETNTDDLLEALQIQLPETWKDLAKKSLGGYTFERLYPVISSWAMQLSKKQNSILKQLEEENMKDLYLQIELPLVPILYEMECNGIEVDENHLMELQDQYQKKMDDLTQCIYALAGHEFNIDSPKQLGVVLFDEIGLKTGKKRSTAADVLEKLAGAHPIVENILEYRKYSKIMSTYIVGLQKYIHSGKIYTTFNQTVTQTGRLSSSDPNLQNISVKDEEGKEIRKVFVAPEGYQLVSADYSQIELRMLAHMANEEHMIQAFQHGMDIHAKTASQLFGVEPDQIDASMRRVAKTVNFGIIYGQTEFGLSQALNITRMEAKEFMQTYFASYPNIHAFMEKTIEFCQEHEYVETMMHRRRWIPEIKDKNFMTREFGKRAAMNAPIQGSAADLIKIAMIKTHDMLEEKGFEAKMLLQIHDELIFLVPDYELESLKEMVQKTMDSAMELKVPLKADVCVGHNWYEAK